MFDLQLELICLVFISWASCKDACASIVKPIVNIMQCKMRGLFISLGHSLLNRRFTGR